MFRHPKKEKRKKEKKKKDVMPHATWNLVHLLKREYEEDDRASLTPSTKNDSI